MAKRDIKVVEVWQNLLENFFKEDVSLDPEFVERFFVSNLVHRSLAHLVGQGDEAGVLIKATAAGELKVAPTTTGLEHNETLADVDVSDNEWHDRIFAQVVSRVDVLVTGFDCKIRRRPTAASGWEGEIMCPKDSFRSFDCVTQGLQVHNVNAGEDPTFEIIGWY